MLHEFNELAKQDNAVAIIALGAIVLLLFLLIILVRTMGYGQGKADDDDGERDENPLAMLLTIFGDTQRDIGATLKRVVDLQDAQGKAEAENNKLMKEFISSVRDDMKGRLQDHESAAEGRTAETLQVIREASEAMKLIPVSLQSIATDVGKNQAAIRAVREGQQSQDRQLKRIEKSVMDVVEKADNASMLEQVLGVLDGLKGMIEQALESRVAVTAMAGSPFTVDVERPVSGTPPLVPPSMVGDKTVPDGVDVGKGGKAQDSPLQDKDIVGSDEGGGKRG